MNTIERLRLEHLERYPAPASDLNRLQHAIDEGRALRCGNLAVVGIEVSEDSTGVIPNALGAALITGARTRIDGNLRIGNGPTFIENANIEGDCLVEDAVVRNSILRHASVVRSHVNRSYIERSTIREGSIIERSTIRSGYVFTNTSVRRSRFLWGATNGRRYTNITDADISHTYVQQPRNERGLIGRTRRRHISSNRNVRNTRRARRGFAQSTTT